MSELIDKCNDAVNAVKTRRGAAPPNGWKGDFQEYWDETQNQVINAVAQTVLEEIILQSNDLEKDVAALVNKIAKEENITLFEDVGS